MTALWHNRRARWFALAVLWAVVLALGIRGFWQQGHAAGAHRTLLDTLYLTLQLATLDYSGSSGPMNWQLQVCRFIVPVMAAGTLLLAASAVFADELNRWRIRRSSGHAVVAGLDDVGLRLATDLARNGERVVAIDPDPARVEAARHAHDGIAAYIGDPTDAGTLGLARLDRARRLVVAAGDDARHGAGAAPAARLAPRRPGPPALRCAVHLGDAELSAVLRTADLDATGQVRVSYFNLHERAARALLSENPPFGADGCRPLVVGLGRFGRSLVVALAPQWAHRRPGEVLPLTLVDANAAGRWGELVQRHPALAEVCSAELIDLDLGAPSAGGLARLAEALAERRPTWVAVVVDDEALALANAVLVHHQMPRSEVPIVVRMRSASGLGTLLDPESGPESAFPGVRVFPLLDRACTVESLDGGIREQLAEAVHEDYLANLPPEAPRGGLQRPWAELGDDDRESSRRRVDGILGDLAAVGCELAPLRRWGVPSLVLTDAEELTLAEREHQRWFDDRTGAGWTYGAERDDAARRNPLLLPWADLPDAVRESNVAAVHALQPMLARSGFEVVRR